MRRIESTSPTGPAPTIKTGSTVSSALKSLDSEKGLLKNGYDNALILVLVVVMALNPLVNLKIPMIKRTDMYGKKKNSREQIIGVVVLEHEKNKSMAFSVQKKGSGEIHKNKKKKAKKKKKLFGVGLLLFSWQQPRKKKKKVFLLFAVGV